MHAFWYNNYLYAQTAHLSRVVLTILTGYIFLTKFFVQVSSMFLLLYLVCLLTFMLGCTNKLATINRGLRYSFYRQRFSLCCDLFFHEPINPRIIIRGLLLVQPNIKVTSWNFLCLDIYRIWSTNFILICIF